MSRFSVLFAAAVLAISLPAAAGNEPHRAYRLGNPATRIAPTLKTEADLRRTLSSETLRDDMQQIARKSGYAGDMEDFWKAVANAPVKEISVAPNTLLPAMSTRRKGKVDVIFNVLWSGRKPFEAFEFSFISGERRYRVVTPKACTNLWVEDQLPPPKSELALSCQSPAESSGDALVEVCCTLTNIGELPEPHAVLALPYPTGAKVRCVSGGPDVSDPVRATWTIESLAPGAAQTVCANFTPIAPGTLTFNASATARRATGVATSSETRVQPAAAGN